MHQDARGLPKSAAGVRARLPSRAGGSSMREERLCRLNRDAAKALAASAVEIKTS